MFSRKIGVVCSALGFAKPNGLQSSVDDGDKAGKITSSPYHHHSIAVAQQQLQLQQQPQQ